MTLLAPKVRFHGALHLYLDAVCCPRKTKVGVSGKSTIALPRFVEQRILTQPDEYATGEDLSSGPPTAFVAAPEFGSGASGSTTADDTLLG